MYACKTGIENTTHPEKFVKNQPNSGTYSWIISMQGPGTRYNSLVVEVSR